MPRSKAERPITLTFRSNQPRSSAHSSWFREERSHRQRIIFKRAKYISAISKLSDRQRQILNLLMEGKPNKIVADILGIGHRTVKSHR
ncbi:helix-turn-helix domain-containing protein [Novosphingobium olei]|uniref:Helix-turn-helix transcriptional regulator n=1 Tax=Novosphingobium olei TaxID=2728851 RepID=A0A7Y0G8G5_9SPHN|nr:helix-turn-helix transcriptional regulator [Novosphingobium olei]